VLGPVPMIVIGPGVLDDHVLGGGGTESRGVDARRAGRVVPRRRLRRLRGHRPPGRGALLFLGPPPPPPPPPPLLRAAAVSLLA